MKHQVPPIYPRFQPGDMVCHVTDTERKGVVTGFMVRGKNHYFEVAWDHEKSQFNLDFELVPAKDPPKQMGFWAERGVE